jgi:uncharacterized integral membrane protein (TIGR00697 family)
MAFNTKRDVVYIVLAGIFICNAIVAELIGGKIINLYGFTLSVGVVLWPVVFLTTDVINEYYGKQGVRKLSIITASLIAYSFIALFIAMKIPAYMYPEISVVSDEQFTAVFGQSMWIIAGSITAFLTSQFVDVAVFWFFRKLTGNKMIWLRSTGSTVISQLVDSFVVTGIAFWWPGKWTTEVYVGASMNGYVFKLLIAIILTPLIYLMHAMVKKYLGSEADNMIKVTANEELHHPV